MRLTELDPRWLMKDGRKVGFIFLSPTGPKGKTHWRQACVFVPMTFREQCAAIWQACDDLKRPEQQHFGQFQTCVETFAWTPHGELDFASLSVTPSIDGSAAGLWHGFVTDGDIR